MAATYTVGTGKTYSTIQGAIDAISGDLSGEGVQTVEVYAGGTGNTYNEAVDADDGFTNPSSSDYIELIAKVSHEGQRASGIIISDSTVDNKIETGDYTVVDGFCVTGSYDGNTEGIRAQDNATIKNCIVYDLTSNNYSAYGFYARGDDVVFINCAAMNITAEDTHAARGFSGVGSDPVAYNCIALNIWSANEAYGFHDIDTLTNCIAGNTDPDASDNDCYDGYNSNHVSTCIADDASLPIALSAFENKDLDDDVKITSSTAGSEDVHLMEDSCAIGEGTDLSATFTEDFEGDTRVNWSIGPDDGPSYTVEEGDTGSFTINDAQLKTRLTTDSDPVRLILRLDISNIVSGDDFDLLVKTGEEDSETTVESLSITHNGSYVLINDLPIQTDMLTYQLTIQESYVTLLELTRNSDTDRDIDVDYLASSIKLKV